uniref:nitric-oxide synthase (NADPH) n=1 Tax=Biomphalaria glabrata TaxID=6526 RepID=A0A2C9K406_BIOGL
FDTLASNCRLNSPEHKARAQEVQLSIKKSGTYDLTRYELIFGAKMAWRNAHRCIGRINWAKLQVFDARGCTTPKEMFEVLCQHIRYSTNNGNIRCAMTVFYQHIDKREDYRIWNSYLISYAAYILEDGTLMGDPKNLEFTEECVKLGWQPTFGNFDLLPIVVSVPGHDPAWFPLPEDLVLQVMITHPEFRWFSDLELQWFALPVLGGLKLDCGGLNFTACAFSGWHLGTQVASRCFCDHNRYNIIPLVASKMSFSKMPLLALDRVVLEVNIAVLYSFLKANVTIVDHHGASNAFLYHLDNEYKVRGGCPAHWPSIVPPLTSSLLGVFHQEMLMYWLKPSFEYQEAAWVGYQWKSPGFSDGSISSDSLKKKQDNSKCMVLSLRLLPETFSSKINCVILFATETGRSEIFANVLRKIFQCAFQVEVRAVRLCACLCVCCVCLCVCVLPMS